MIWEEARDKRKEEEKRKDAIHAVFLLSAAPKKTRTPGRVDTSASQRCKRIRRG